MKIFETYKISADGVPAEITISRKDEEFVDSYDIKLIKLHTATEIALRHLKERIVEDVSLKALELLDTKEAGAVKRKFVDKAAPHNRPSSAASTPRTAAGESSASARDSRTSWSTRQRSRSGSTTRNTGGSRATSSSKARSR
ncbi:MAG: hypothetical protein NT157_00580 [Candidatus Micrarchaeota archaeon]|nr:hypothetical protein [Candidatus Micrarchaeota archaeon]